MYFLPKMMAGSDINGNLFRLEQVSYSSGEVEILHDITLEVPRGEIVLLTGPSGSGKSTLLRIFNTLLTPSRGRVYYKGKDLGDFNPVEFRSRTILSGQKPILLEGTVRDNLLLPFSLKSNQGRQADDHLFAGLLEKVDLPSSFLDKKAGMLSGGEAQRMALARVLALRPETLLLDEPTSALDISHEERVLAFMESLRGKINLIVVAHSTAYLDLADRVIILKNGRLNRLADELSATEFKAILGENI
ncbi:MAG: ATP-binding cassette domain-containing protein [candidate division Zixibacteria bacterium]|nr:ATP-binding cassette domain-containing protein [candidate division Zixibacteria bacterium]